MMKNTIKNKILNSTENTHYNSKLTKGGTLYVSFTFFIIFFFNINNLFDL